MPFAVGETIGPYRILEQLGRGGMATVFKAYHPALDRHVAIKAMHPAFMEEPNFQTRFQREAQVVARLDHPNIVPVYDFAEHQGRSYLVMKFIEGETLKARLTRGPLSTQELLNTVEALGAALAYAHQEGILHRDIKPSNVLLTPAGHIYLADFGLARIAEAGQSTLSSEVMMGTPQYISPEQAIGKEELGAATDIYSLGVMLYEVIVGQVPFNADTPYSIIHDHIYTPLPLPRSINSAVPEVVELVLLKALAKEAQDRFSDIPAFVEAFKRAISGRVSAGMSPGALDNTLLPSEQGGAAVIAHASPLANGSAESGIGPEEQPRSRGATGAADAAPTTAPATVRRWRWWYLLPLVAGMCLCGLLGTGALGELGSVEPGVDSPGAQLTAELAATEPMSDEPPPVDEPLDALDAALQNVRAHPDDPFAHLELAGAQYDAGHVRGAQQSISEALSLAGEGNVDFYNAAGDLFVERELWLLAAAMYLETVSALPGRPPAPLRDKLSMSIYLAAQDEEAQGVFGQRDAAPNVELNLIDTARARYQLYRGEPELAQEILDQVLARAANYPPAQLLQAEIFLAGGEIETAAEILHALHEQESAPEWVRALAGVVLDEAVG